MGHAETWGEELFRQMEHKHKVPEVGGYLAGLRNSEEGVDGVERSYSAKRQRGNRNLHTGPGQGKVFGF